MRRQLRRLLLGWIAPGLVAACGSRTEGGAASERDHAPHPDIILVSIDSLRFDHVGCYGYKKPTTPNIDRIAGEGVRCESAVSTSSWTLPAHAAMFTGLFDSTHGLVDNGLRLSEEQPTLAAVLKANGYQTAGFFGGPYLHPAFGFGHGFLHYESCMSPLGGDAHASQGAKDAKDASAPKSSATSPSSAPTLADLERSHADVTGPRTLDAVTKWLGRDVDERPLFLFVHLWDVHYDYNPPREYAAMFDPDYTGKLDASNLMKNPEVNAHMAPRDFDHLVALYDGEIRFTDEILGKILALLEKRGRMSKTLLVITADHGEEFFEHAGKGHQRTLFDEVVRVPLIVRWPDRLDAGRVVRDQVRTIDLMPTLLAAAGAAKQPPMQGRDILPLWRGETLPPEPALCELLVDKNDVRALRTNERKIIDYRAAKTKVGYDLVQDPKEQRALVGDVPLLDEVRKTLLHMLEASVSSHSKFGPGAQPLAPSSELEKRIHGLGYGGANDAHPK